MSTMPKKIKMTGKHKEQAIKPKPARPPAAAPEEKAPAAAPEPPKQLAIRAYRLGMLRGTMFLENGDRRYQVVILVEGGTPFVMNCDPEDLLSLKHFIEHMLKDAVTMFDLSTKES